MNTTKTNPKVKTKISLATATHAQMVESISVIRRLLKLFEPKRPCHWDRARVADIIAKSEKALTISESIVKLIGEFDTNKQQSDINYPFNVFINAAAHAVFIGEMSGANVLVSKHNRDVALNKVDNIREKAEAILSTITSEGMTLGCLLEDNLSNLVYDFYTVIQEDTKLDVESKYDIMITRIVHGDIVPELIEIIGLAFDFLTFKTPKALKDIRNNVLSNMNLIMPRVTELISVPKGKLSPIGFITDGNNIDILYFDNHNKRKIWNSQLRGSEPVIANSEVRLFRILKLAPKPVFKEVS